MTAYGLFALVQMLGIFTQAAVDYGFSFTATRSVVQVKDDRIERGAILVNVTAAKILIYGACLVVLFLASHLFLWNEYSEVIQAYFPYSLLTVSSLLIPIWYFQGIGDIFRAAIFTSFARISSLVVIVVFVGADSTLTDIAWLYSAPAVVVALFFWMTSLPERPGWRLVSRHRVVHVLKQGRHIFVTNILSIGVTNAGPLIISMVSGPAAVGVFAAAERVAKTISYIYGPLTQVIYPRVVSAFKIGHLSGVQYIKKVMILYICSGIFFGAAGFWGSDSIMGLLGAPEADASLILRWLSVWVVISVVNNVMGLQLLTALDLSQYYMRGFLGSSLIYIVLAVLLTHYFSSIGPAIALLMSEFCLSIYLTLKAKKLMAYDDERSR